MLCEYNMKQVICGGKVIAIYTNTPPQVGNNQSEPRRGSIKLMYVLPNITSLPQQCWWLRNNLPSITGKLYIHYDRAYLVGSAVWKEL